MQNPLKRWSPSVASSSTLTSVRALYEAYPYPCYPLFATPRWQDGYLTHSGFAACVGSGDARGGAVNPSSAVLIGGGGEILPYIIRKWEARQHAVISIDLSRHSTLRARWRTLFSSKRTRFLRGDLDAYLDQQSPGAFSHIDAYGVLHHMPNPSHTLLKMAKALAPGGTLRLMVYNSRSRRWIHQLQHLLGPTLLGIDRFDRSSLQTARHLLKQAAALAPAIAARLNQLGPGTMRNSGRFADTFLHPREARLSIQHWYEAIARAGLEVVGLFDRYGELDDLSNPLAVPPSAAELEARAADGRYENNLELFIRKATTRTTPQPSGPPRARATWLYRLKPPPSLWFTYRETQALSWPLRLGIWHAHLDWVLNHKRGQSTALIAKLPKTALQRLLRLGAILPGQIEDPGRRLALASPMAQSMEPPQPPAPQALAGSEVEPLLQQLLAQAGRGGPRHLRQALARLDQTQIV